MRFRIWIIVTLLLLHSTSIDASSTNKSEFLSITDLEYDPDHSQIISVGRSTNYELVIWQVKDTTVEPILGVDDQNFNFRSVSYSNNLLYVGNSIGEITPFLYESDRKIWDQNDVLPIFQDTIDQIQLVSEDSFLVAGGYSVYIVTDGREIIIPFSDGLERGLVKEAIFDTNINQVIIHTDNELQAWDLTTGEMLYTYESDIDGFSLDLNSDMIAYKIGNVISFVTNNGETVYSMRVNSDNPSAEIKNQEIEFSTDSRMLAISDNNIIEVYSLETQNLMMRGESDSRINVVEWINETHVMTGDDSGRIIIWQVTNGFGQFVQFSAVIDPFGKRPNFPIGYKLAALYSIFLVMIIIIAFRKKPMTKKKLKFSKQVVNDKLYPEYDINKEL